MSSGDVKAGSCVEDAGGWSGGETALEIDGEHDQLATLTATLPLDGNLATNKTAATGKQARGWREAHVEFSCCVVSRRPTV